MEEEPKMPPGVKLDPYIKLGYILTTLKPMVRTASEAEHSARTVNRMVFELNRNLGNVPGKTELLRASLKYNVDTNNQDIIDEMVKRFIEVYSSI